MFAADSLPGISEADSYRVVRVGLAEWHVTGEVQTELVAQSLGSCLAVVIHDPIAAVGGMLHVMLPDSSIHVEKAQECPAMFVDTGLPLLFKSAYAIGADKYRIITRVIGGADLLSSNSQFTGIGKRNFDALCRMMDRNGVRIQSAEVGGHVSRTVLFRVNTGKIEVRIPGRPVIEM